MKAYRQKLDLDFQNFLELIRGFEERKNKFYLLFHLPFKTPREKLEDFSPNIYVEILRYLCESKYPQKHKNIIEAIGKDSDFQKLHWKLKRLGELELVKYEEKRYSLTKKGKKFVSIYLISPMLKPFRFIDFPLIILILSLFFFYADSNKFYTSFFPCLMLTTK